MINRNVCTTIYNGGHQYRVCLRSASASNARYRSLVQAAKRRKPRMSDALIRKKVLTYLQGSGHSVRV